MNVENPVAKLIAPSKTTKKKPMTMMLSSDSKPIDIQQLSNYPIAYIPPPWHNKAATIQVSMLTIKMPERYLEKTKSDIRGSFNIRCTSIQPLGYAHKSSTSRSLCLRPRNFPNYNNIHQPPPELTMNLNISSKSKGNQKIDSFFASPEAATNAASNLFLLPVTLESNQS